MANPPTFDIEIDKLTRSIENAISGESFTTQILELTSYDLKHIKQSDWLFDWKYEAEQADKAVHKPVIIENSDIIQGLISIQDRGDHIFMALSESSKFNRGTNKLYLSRCSSKSCGLCQLSFDKGYAGYVSFESKPKLKEHYRNSLGANVLFGNIMAIDTKAARTLVDQYFPENM